LGKDASCNSLPVLSQIVTGSLPQCVAAVLALLPTCMEMLLGLVSIIPSAHGVISTDAPVSPIQILGSRSKLIKVGNICKSMSAIVRSVLIPQHKNSNLSVGIATWEISIVLLSSFFTGLSLLRSLQTNLNSCVAESELNGQWQTWICKCFQP
jgi:hypothetical protein